jgi:hypothetical protein
MSIKSPRRASCTAGRASFLTGRLPIRSALSIVVAPGDENRLRKETPTIVEFFQRNGYITYFSGPPHPSKPIMRRPRADLEEKHEPPGTLSANAEPNAGEKRNEVNKIAFDECRDREEVVPVSARYGAVGGRPPSPPSICRPNLHRTLGIRTLVSVRATLRQGSDAALKGRSNGATALEIRFGGVLCGVL